MNENSKPRDSGPWDSTSRRWLRPLMRPATFLGIGYIGLLSMLVYLENRLVYHPVTAKQHWMPAPPRAGIVDVELTSADGTRIHAWWCPAPGSDRAVLYCHGNAGNLSHRGDSIVKLRDDLDASVLIIDYPGYGKSEGAPSEQGCYQAAEAAYQWLTETKRIEPRNVLLFGASLGGGVITDLASRKEHRALVLVKTFTSLPDVASELYWWLPAPKRLLMSNQFDSLARIKSCKRPIFIAHGDTDTLIPIAHGQRLYQEANEPKHFLSLPNNGHNDPLPEEFYRELKRFLADNR